MKSNLTPKYLTSQLVYVADIQPYNLRRTGDFRLCFFF